MDVEENDSLVLLSNSMTLEPKNSSYYSSSCYVISSSYGSNSRYFSSSNSSSM